MFPVHETYFMFYLPSQKKVALACRWIWSYLRTWCWWVEVEVWMAHHFQIGVQCSVFPLRRWRSERIVHKLSICPGMPFLLWGTPLTWKPHFCQPTLRRKEGHISFWYCLTTTHVECSYSRVRRDSRLGLDFSYFSFQISRLGLVSDSENHFTEVSVSSLSRKKAYKRFSSPV